MKFLLYVSIFYCKLTLFLSMNFFFNKNYKSVNNEQNIKLCINCKYFLPSRSTGDEFGKCAIYSSINNNDENYLVTGKIKKESIKYKYCSTSRSSEHMCGREGKDFIPK